VLNVTEFFGPEDPQPASGGGRDRVVDLPGIGPVTTGQLHQAGQHVSQVLDQISGGTDLLREPTPERLVAALARLDSLHAQGGVIDDQYQALIAAAASLTG
jgi:hypothetical protein